jgi:hypothetical protein
MWGDGCMNPRFLEECRLLVCDIPEDGIFHRQSHKSYIAFFTLAVANSVIIFKTLSLYPVQRDSDTPSIAWNPEPLGMI